MSKISHKMSNGVNHQNKTLKTISIYKNKYSKTLKGSGLVILIAAFIMGGFFAFTGTANAIISSIDVVEPGSVIGQELKFPFVITWTAVGDPGDTVDIYYSTNNFVTSTKLTASALAFDMGSYEWNPVVKPTDGTTYKVRVQSTGNAIQGTSINDFMIDNTAPTTTYAINPTTPNGLNGWYVSIPTITLTCSDDTGSGCNKTWYKWDNIGPWIDNSITPVAATQGEHTLSFYSDDQAVNASGFHNEETVKTQTIKVDTIFPTVAVTSTTANGSYNVPDTINVTLTFSEAVSSTGTLTVALNSGGTCSVPILTNATTGTCTYTVGTGQNSPDLTVTSIVPVSGVVEDVAGNDSTLSPTSNIADTNAIVIDTTAPIDFTVGTVVVTGGTVVPGWWNSTNTGVDVVVPVANDVSLTGGTIQLQAKAKGNFENVGTAYVILVGDINTTKILSLTAAQLEAIAGFSDGDSVTFTAIITDLAGNPTTSTPSATILFVDQTAPLVDAGTDKEVNTLVSQVAVISDGVLGSGIATYAWTKSFGVGTVIFSNQSGATIIANTNISITDVSPAGDGTYTITLTVTDIAGNVNSDTIQFAWDTIAPALTQTTPISTPTNNNTPSYVFSVDSVKQLLASVGGGITYGGSCGSGAPSSAIAGVNTTTYGPLLVDATYAGCTIIVTDAAGNASSALAVPSFEIDTMVAAIFSITTTDANLDGMVDTTTIVFSDEVNDSTIFANIGQFTIGGIVATTFLTGITVDDNTVVLSHAGVAGTNAKTVVYATGTATDLAGNAITGFSQTSTDAAGPILLSAKTKTTTTIDTIWSEDIAGGTVNGSGNEFVVTGYLVTAASETSDGVVTLTVATMPTDAIPLVTFTSTLFKDINGNTAPSPQSKTATDGVAPVLTAVSISSNNDPDFVAPEWAKAGDVVTLIFTSSEVIAIPTVLIQGVAATSITNAGNIWTATRTMTVTDTPQGTLGFSIVFKDVSPATNDGVTVTATTDLSTVFFDRTAPEVNAGTDKEVNAVVSQNAIVSDPAPSSGGLIYAWTMVSGPGLITFGTPAVKDTTISANTDGTYTIRLTVSDNAGNVEYDEIIFIWDTTPPVAITSTPSEGTTGVSKSAGTTTVQFTEKIKLTDSGKVLFVDSIGTSHKGAVAVNGGDGTSDILNIDYSALDYGIKYRINVIPSPQGSNSLSAVTDIAGNKLVTPWTSYFTTEIDTVPPVVNSSSAGSITTTGATLNVTTNENANCRYAITDSEFASMTTFMTTGTASHYTAVSGLTPSTGYDFYVRCADTSPKTNTMTTSAHISFTTLTPDITAPVIANIQASVSDTGATIIWATNELATSRVEYGLTSGYGNLTIADASADNTSHSVALSGLTPGTTYHFRVLSTDSSLNAGVSGDNTFTTTDTTAPAVPVFTTSNATTDADTYTLAGTVANDGGNRTINVYNGAIPAGTTVVPTGLTAWSILVSLTQNASNVFTATASDAAGNTSGASSPITIIEATTTGDITAPATPVITTSPATVDADTYTIKGTAGADLPIDGSRTITIYNNNVVMGSIILLSGETNWSFVSSLNQNTANIFTAYSTDESGNTSVSSNSVIITEATSADTTAPVISNVQTNPIGITTATITWATDEASTSQVEYGLTSIYGASTTLDTTLTTSHSVIVSGLTSSTVYHFRVKSKDALLNEGVSEDNTFKTLVDDSTAILRVTNISAIKTFATADGTYENGWSWIFNVTVPTLETDLQMKFADWASSLNTISVAGNIRYSSAQANPDTVEITATNTYGDALNLISDIDSGVAGRQIEILVEARIPAGSEGGSYSTSYGIKSSSSISD